jgi:superkiller protein 3
MRTGTQLSPLRRIASVSDRTLRRLTRAGVLILVTGVPLFAAVYYMDQHVDAGPSLADRRVEAAEQLVRKQPDNVTYRLGLAQAYVMSGRRDDALVQYDEVLKGEPGHRVALLGRGDLLRERGDLAGAAEMYTKLIGPAAKGEFAGADTTLAAAYYGLAAVQLAQRRPKQAVSTLEQVLQIDPTDADAWYLMGSASLRAGAPARAVEAFRKAVLFVPTGWCEPYGAMASAYKALKRAPSAQYARAMADFCGGRVTEARERLAGLTSGPAALDAMLGLGMVAEAQTDRAAAAGWYRKALKLDPKSFVALSGLTRLGQPAPAGSPKPPAH